jgi:hypothetical protein
MLSPLDIFDLVWAAAMICFAIAAWFSGLRHAALLVAAAGLLLIAAVFATLGADPQWPCPRKAVTHERA